MKYLIYFDGSAIEDCKVYVDGQATDCRLIDFDREGGEDSDGEPYLLEEFMQIEFFEESKSVAEFCTRLNEAIEASLDEALSVFAAENDIEYDAKPIKPIELPALICETGSYAEIAIEDVYDESLLEELNGLIQGKFAKLLESKLSQISLRLAYVDVYDDFHGTCACSSKSVKAYNPSLAANLAKFDEMIQFSDTSTPLNQIYKCVAEELNAENYWTFMLLSEWNLQLDVDAIYQELDIDDESFDEKKCKELIEERLQEFEHLIKAILSANETAMVDEMTAYAGLKLEIETQIGLDVIVKG